jgi:putative peptidoglycan lipid II flippase
MNALLVGPFGHVGLAVSTSGVALVNCLLLGVFMRRKLGGIAGRELSVKALRITAASVPMAGVAWLVNDFAALLPLVGLALNLVRVSLAIALAAITFYFACRLFQVAEVDEAVGAIGGRLLRLLRRK